MKRVLGYRNHHSSSNNNINSQTTLEVVFQHVVF